MINARVTLTKGGLLMSRKLYSPTRTIPNRGDLPKYIGQFPCAKAEASHLVFDSLGALYCGIYLEWRPDVVSMAFEPHMLTFEAEAGLPELTCHQDYEATPAANSSCSGVRA